MGQLSRSADQPALSNSELARRGFVTRRTMNDILVGLEKAGLISREPHPDNGRIQAAHLTPAGTRAVAAADHAAVEVKQRMLTGLGAEQRRALLTLLATCADNLESSPTR